MFKLMIWLKVFEILALMMHRKNEIKFVSNDPHCRKMDGHNYKKNYSEKMGKMHFFYLKISKPELVAINLCIHRRNS